MYVTEQVTINAPAAQVWHVLAENYATVGAWASAIAHSTVNDDVADGAVGRVCHTDFGQLKETVTQFDEHTGTFAYHADGMPFFVREAGNTWTVRPHSADTTVVDMRLEMTFMPIIGRLMQPIMRRQMQHTARDFVEELKHYVETGQIHPRKLAAQAKAAKKGHKPALTN